jgi:hypothetical protein
LLEQVVKLAAVTVFVVGVITLASPWLRKAAERQLPPAGWICWDVTRSTLAGSRREGRCEPSRGWGQEHWDGVGDVAVPPPWRRHWVRDGF